jgi:hypothetical protein
MRPADTLARRSAMEDNFAPGCEGCSAMNDTTNNRIDEDIFAREFSDEQLEAAADHPNCVTTFTCGLPMCGTGGSCGTWISTCGP